MFICTTLNDGITRLDQRQCLTQIHKGELRKFPDPSQSALNWTDRGTNSEQKFRLSSNFTWRVGT